jgi:hypothetical protein
MTPTIHASLPSCCCCCCLYLGVLFLEEALLEGGVRWCMRLLALVEQEVGTLGEGGAGGDLMCRQGRGRRGHNVAGLVRVAYAGG